MTRRSSALPIPSLAINRQQGTSLERQVYVALREAILDGRLRAGVQLPSTRQLAQSLGVARNVAVAAFDRLAAEGYIHSHVGSGSFVADGQQRRRMPSWTLRPRTSRWAHVAETLAEDCAALDAHASPIEPLVPERRSIEIVSRWWRDPSQSDTSIPGLGLNALRDAIADYVGVMCGIACRGEDVLITSGDGRIYQTLARVFADPGEPVVIEDPCSPVVRAMYEAGDVLPVAWPFDDEGIAIDWSSAIDPRLVHVTPSGSAPFGLVMADNRRRQLLQWAATHRTLIIEHDPQRAIVARRPALKAIDWQGQVIYASSFSTMFPHLDLGFVIATPPVIELLGHAQRFFGGPPPMAQQSMMATFIVEGDYARALRRLEGSCSEQMDAWQCALEAQLRWIAASISTGADSTSIVRFPDDIDDRAVASEARRRGVQVTPLSSFFVRSPQSGLVIQTGTIDSKQVSRAVASIADAIASARTVAPQPVHA